jgi:mannose-6-phosphate isomerase-like protein (cupin superfamily)
MSNACLKGAAPMDKIDDRYDIRTEVLFPQGQHMDVASLAASIQPWSNRTLTQVNDAVVRLGVLEGDFHWHKHDDEDEFFYVIEGQLDIELPDRMVSLLPGQGVTVPRGVMHFPHARGRTVALMVEKGSVDARGD